MHAPRYPLDLSIIILLLGAIYQRRRGTRFVDRKVDARANLRFTRAASDYVVEENQSVVSSG